MSTVVFEGQQIPDKKIEAIYYFKAYLSEGQKHEIMEELRSQLPGVDGMHVTMHVIIEAKKMKK